MNHFLRLLFLNFIFSLSLSSQTILKEGFESLRQEHIQSDYNSNSVWGERGVKLLKKGKAPMNFLQAYPYYRHLAFYRNDGTSLLRYAMINELDTSDRQSHALYLKLIADQYLEESQFPKYKNILHTALKKSTHADSLLYLDILSGLGGVSYYYENLPAALQFNIEAIKIARSLNDTLERFRVNLNLGAIYGQMGFKKTGFNFLLQSEVFGKNIPDSRKSMLYNNLGSYLKMEGSMDLALSYLRKIDFNTPVPASVYSLSACNFYDICSHYSFDSALGCDTAYQRLVNATKKFPLSAELCYARIYDYKFTFNSPSVAMQWFNIEKETITQDTISFWNAFGMFFLNHLLEGESIPLTTDELLHLRDVLLDSEDKEAIIQHLETTAILLSKEGRYEESNALYSELLERIKETERQMHLLATEDFSIAYRNDSLRAALQMNMVLMDLKEKSNQIYRFSTWLGALLILIILLATYFSRAFFRLKAINKLKDQVNFKQQKQSFENSIRQAQKVNKMNAVLSSYQNVLSENINKWLISIRKIQTIHPQIDEIEHLKFEMNSSIQLLKKYSYQEKWSEFRDLFNGEIPALNCEPPLNLMEQKVLIFCYLGLSSKEIGIMLDRSDRYLNNVKSKIRQRLNLGSGVSLEDFMQDLIHNQ